MTDYTAIYEAAESLVSLLRREMSPEPVAKPELIGLCEPQDPEDYQLTVWIYNIEEIKDTGMRTGFSPDPMNPGMERWASIQLKLHLLVSAHSKAAALQKYADRYRIIGRAIQLIRDNPSIPPECLQGTLAEQTEPVLLEITKLSAEELSRVWNNTSKTVVPSFGVTVSQVFMKSNRTRQSASRVTSAEFETRDQIRRRPK